MIITGIQRISYGLNTALRTTVDSTVSKVAKFIFESGFIVSNLIKERPFIFISIGIAILILNIPPPYDMLIAAVSILISQICYFLVAIRAKNEKNLFLLYETKELILNMSKYEQGICDNTTQIHETNSEDQKSFSDGTERDLICL